MRMVTGSPGWLGQTLVPSLSGQGHDGHRGLSANQVVNRWPRPPIGHLHHVRKPREQLEQLADQLG